MKNANSDLSDCDASFQDSGSLEDSDFDLEKQLASKSNDLPDDNIDEAVIDYFNQGDIDQAEALRADFLVYLVKKKDKMSQAQLDISIKMIHRVDRKIAIQVIEAFSKMQNMLLKC